MLTASLHPSRLILLTGAVLFANGIAYTQDNPNRPPWAQKSQKSGAKADSTSSSNSSATASPQPAGPIGEPGIIVQPTPVPPKEEKPEPAVQGNAIRVNVNLVTVLV